jgi:hypothetical protein
MFSKHKHHEMADERGFILVIPELWTSICWTFLPRLLGAPEARSEIQNAFFDEKLHFRRDFEGSVAVLPVLFLVLMATMSEGKCF